MYPQRFFYYLDASIIPTMTCLVLEHCWRLTESESLMLWKVKDRFISEQNNYISIHHKTFSLMTAMMMRMTTLHVPLFLGDLELC